MNLLYTVWKEQWLVKGSGRRQLIQDQKIDEWGGGWTRCLTDRFLSVTQEYVCHEATGEDYRGTKGLRARADMRRKNR
jgi:hypothetical protein